MAPRLNVLIVDDSAATRRIVRTILAAQAGLEVMECADGPAALETLARWPIDLVLVDFEMRPMDGETLVKLIREGHGLLNPDVPILMMTGHADTGRVVRARDAGVDGLIVKPLSAGLVIERIDAALIAAAKRIAAKARRRSVEI